MATGYLDLDSWQCNSGAAAEAYNSTMPYKYVDYWRTSKPDWYPYYLTGGNWEVEKLLMDTEVFEMYVYNILLVNTEECEVVQQYENVVAESEKLAMLEIALSLDAKKLHKKGKLKFIFTLVGGFNRFKKSEE